MSEKIIKLTEQEFNEHIKSIFESVTDEIDGKTQSRYVFYATDHFGRTCFLTFKFQGIKKLMKGVAILSGDIVFDGDKMTGNILVDFNKQVVQYTERGTRYKYNLEIDNRVKANWDNLLAEMKASLDNK